MKYLLYIAISLIIGYFSMEIKPLDQVKNTVSKFEAQSLAKKIMEGDYPKVFSKAIELKKLIVGLSTDKQKAITQYGKAVSLGNIKYFLVKGKAKIVKVNEDDMLINIDNQNYTLATEFIYGAAVRDAGGLFDIKNFPVAAEVQALTGEINKYVRNDVVKPFKQKVKKGDLIDLIGAIELNQAHYDVTKLIIQPIYISIANQ